MKKDKFYWLRFGLCIMVFAVLLLFVLSGATFQEPDLSRAIFVIFTISFTTLIWYVPNQKEGYSD